MNALCLENENIQQLLTELSQEGALRQALLLEGPNTVDKNKMAQELARSYAKPGDIHTFKPCGKLGLHPIESIRRLIEQIYLSSNANAYRVFIIEEAEKMLPSSANALLKTLEEPPGHSQIILTSSFPKDLLTTIRSRCVKIRLKAKGIEKALSPTQLLFKEMLGPQHYDSFKERLAALSKSLNDTLKGFETAESQEQDPRFKDLPSSVKEQLEKEAQGTSSRHYQSLTQELFQVLLQDYREEESSARWKKISYTQLLELIDLIQTQLRRSSKIEPLIEYLFLKLSWL